MKAKLSPILFFLQGTIFLLLWRRSLWIDEIQAMQIARTYNLNEIVELLGYERHPIGWYFILKSLWLISGILNIGYVEITKVFHSMVLLATFYQIQQLHFSRKIKLGLSFSTCLILVPGLLIRPYLLANLLLLLALKAYFDKNHRRLLIVIIVLSQIQVIYLLVSIALFFKCLYREHNRHFFLTFFFISSSIITIYACWPEGDSVTSNAIQAANFQDLFKGPLVGIAPFLPFLPNEAQLFAALVVSVILIVLLIEIYKLNREVFWVISLLLISSSITFAILKANQPWHTTFLFVGAIACLDRTFLSRLLRFSLTTLILFQLIILPDSFAVRAIKDELGGKPEFRQAIIDYCEGKNIVASNDHLALYLAFEMNKKVLNLQSGKSISSIEWKAKVEDNSLGDGILRNSCIFSDKSNLPSSVQSNEWDFQLIYHESGSRIYSYWLFSN